jgi:predicted AAA+ superfamily ATPase
MGKAYLLDAGLLASLLGIGPQQVAAHDPLLGPLLETFVVMEVAKQATWNAEEIRLSHFHTHQGKEADLVLEDSAGHVVGIEVKAAATLQGRDFCGLQALAEAAGPAFLRGLLLYLGDKTLPFGPGMWALPLESLWSWGAHPNGSASPAG